MIRLSLRANLKNAKKFSKKRVYCGDDARNRLFRGSNYLSDTVAKTLGPGGRNICIESEIGKPKITKDGVSVCKNIFTPDNEVSNYFFYNF